MGIWIARDRHGIYKSQYRSSVRSGRRLALGAIDHECAACADGVDQAFFGQELDGPADGSACYVVLLLQVALAGQLVRDLSRRDLVAQDRGELLIQRCGVAVINNCHAASVKNVQVRMTLRYGLPVLYV
jgi:hypothetical protein